MSVAPVKHLIFPYVNADEADPHDRPDILSAITWLKSNPGRWGLIGYRHYDLVQGFQPKTATRAGLKASKRTEASGAEKYYAQLPAPGAATLEDSIAATRWARRFYPEDLPRLERDPFKWTPRELETAILAAIELLDADPADFLAAAA